MADPRLAVFVELNAKGKKKAPWQERVALVNEVFPSFVRLDWHKAFAQDVELWGEFIEDILKLDQAEPGRSGPRPNLDRGPALARLREYMGDDYSEQPFPDALLVLAGSNNSVRAIAYKTGLLRSFVHRLLVGERVVDMVTVERIAKAYKKDPGYFLEYRVACVLAALGDRLVISPETTVGLYRRLKGDKADG